MSRRALCGMVATLPLLLAGCGLKGPLYLPTRPAAATPAPASVPTTTTTVTTTTIVTPSSPSK
ncbi:MAG TPA: hypothetical protein DHV59_04520 [Oxalobacteraceae bacterium]|nr:hypothetical protein [Oxalobacteraceae bacterium]